MNQSNHVFISPYKCPFKFNGTNIAEMRRVEVAKVARAVNAIAGSSIDCNSTKNEMLTQVIAIGNSRKWEAELSELFQSAVESVTKVAQPAVAEKKKGKKKK